MASKCPSVEQLRMLYKDELLTDEEIAIIFDVAQPMEYKLGAYK